MFQFPGLAPRLPEVTGLQPARFSHSEICGSMLACSYPQLIAAYHVLHRLLMPRHSPCALPFLNPNSEEPRSTCTPPPCSHLLPGPLHRDVEPIKPFSTRTGAAYETLSNFCSVILLVQRPDALLEERGVLPNLITISSQHVKERCRHPSNRTA